MAEKKSRTKTVAEGGNTTIAVTKETQKKLRILAALRDKQIKEIVEELVEEELKK